MIAAPTRLYHLPRSRSTRILWTLGELGAPFEVSVMTAAGRKSEAHLARHPPGRVPVTEDGAGHLFESGAIVLALADRLHFPLGTRERELVYQWVLFAVAELEPPVLEVRDHRDADPARAAVARERFAAAAAPVGRAIDSRGFTSPTASALQTSWSARWRASRGASSSSTPFPGQRYLDELKRRPAFQHANAPA